jgi:AcrR family transcriptional regulator
MPRAGLDTGRVVREALRVVDDDGLGALTIATLAGRLGVKRPSLYNHVSGMEGLKDALRAFVYAEVADLVEEVSPRTGRAALMSLAAALRRYVVSHPHRIDLLLENVEDSTGPLREESDRLLGKVMDTLGGYGLSGAAAVHAARTLRALWIGFALIHARGGYALNVPVEDSYTFAIDSIHRALSAGREKGGRSGPG